MNLREMEQRLPHLGIQILTAMLIKTMLSIQMLRLINSSNLQIKDDWIEALKNEWRRH